MTNPNRPANRQFDLWSMLPKHNRRQDATGDLRRFISCLQTVTDELLADVDRFPEIFDLERAPEDFLDAILQDLGNPFKFDLLEIEKRRLAATLLNMHKLKGTAPGIKIAVRFFLGFEIDIVPYAAESLILGVSELGEDWILGPSEDFSMYAFDVRVGQELSEGQRNQTRALVDELRPGHTHFIRLLEPSEPTTELFWVLGIGELGISSLLG